ncbi:hypothetical protein [Clostridium paraputrificum]|uniref:hypothetical protein n=1 Tax=Clostridium paraputrificum TaxID=29363 RepID=UPI0034A20385
MNKKKFLKIFEMCIADEDVVQINVKIFEPIGYKIITFDRDKFNEKYEYYKNNYDSEMRLKSCTLIFINEIDFCVNE